MKTKRYKIVLFIAILFSTPLIGQIQGMVIYKSDGTTVRAQISTANSIATVDSIRFFDCVDADGNVYITVKIGNQWWMAENLKTTKYRDGTEIPNEENNTTWAGLSTGAYCYYNNDSSSYAATYGALYNWHAVNNVSGLAPAGWHVATDDEWTTLTNYLGGSSVAGKKLKSSSGWTTNTGTDEVGFGALPGGYRNYLDGYFSDVGTNAYFWSSSEINSSDAWYRYLFDGFDDIYRINYHKNYGFSVRCVKDAE